MMISDLLNRSYDQFDVSQFARRSRDEGAPVFDRYDSELAFSFGESKNVPVATIIIPTYRRQDLLLEALSSAFNQNFKETYEVLVVDNHFESDIDEVLKFVQKCLKRKENVLFNYYKNRSNIGMFNNWNAGVSKAKGQYVTILHDDDLLFQGFLLECFEVLSSEPDFAGVAANHEVQFLKKTDAPKTNKFRKLFKHLDEKLFWLPPEGQMFANRFLIHHRIHGTLGVLIRKATIVEHGGFDQDLAPTADFVFWERLIRSDKIYWLNKIQCACRIGVNEKLSPFMPEKFIITGFLMREHRIEQSKFFIPLKKKLNVLFTNAAIGFKGLTESNDEGRVVNQSLFSRLKYRVLASLTVLML